jgi:hypothetical protein
VISDEVNRAMINACAAHQAEISEFTVAPRLLPGEGNSYHEWFVEFALPPADPAAFNLGLDAEMRKQNSYYNDLRTGNMLRPAQVRVLAGNATREYMKSQGKLGGQNKFPRLSNNRIIADWLLDHGLAEGEARD